MREGGLDATPTADRRGLGFGVICFPQSRCAAGSRSHVGRAYAHVHRVADAFQHPPARLPVACALSPACRLCWSSTTGVRCARPTSGRIAGPSCADCCANTSSARRPSKSRNASGRRFSPRRARESSVSRLVELTFATTPEVSITIEILSPEGRGPFPVLFTQTNHRRWGLIALARGYLVCIYPARTSTTSRTSSFPCIPSAIGLVCCAVPGRPAARWTTCSRCPRSIGSAWRSPAIRATGSSR